MEKEKELLEEEKKLRKLTRIVDVTAALLRQSDFTLSEAQNWIAFSRDRVLELFPDKGETFDLIYGSRFRRILVDKYHLI